MVYRRTLRDRNAGCRSTLSARVTISGLFAYEPQQLWRSQESESGISSIKPDAAFSMGGDRSLSLVSWHEDACVDAGASDDAAGKGGALNKRPL